MSKSIKILICYHKPSDLIKDDILTPIHVGRALALKKSGNKKDLQWMLENMIGDDTGDNISEKNSSYNELTAVYWAWKNYDVIGDPDYIGFMHYRRHFLFRANDRVVQKVSGIDDDYFDYINYNQESMEHLFDDCDYIAHIGRVDKVYDHYRSFHHIEDLELAISILKNKYPAFSKTADDYMNMSDVNFCNMFIMPKTMFFEYCSWLFDILEDFERKVDLSEKRLFISERLTGIFIEHKKRQGFKQKALPSTFVASEMTVPVALSYDGVPFHAAVTMQSILKHKSSEAFVKFYILHDGNCQKHAFSCFENKSDCSVTFIDVKNTLKEKGLYQKGMVFPKDYPEVVSEVVPDGKILFFDERVFFFGDVANFYTTCNNDEFWILGLPVNAGERPMRGNAFSLNAGRLRSHGFLKSLNGAWFDESAVTVFEKFAVRQTNGFPWWLYSISDLEHDGNTFYDIPRGDKRWGVWDRALHYYDEGMEPWKNIQGLISKFWWEVAQELPASVGFCGFSEDAGRLMYEQSAALCRREKRKPIVVKEKSVFAKTYDYYKKYGYKRTVRKIISKLRGK